MHTTQTTPRSHRPKPLTVFAAAFIAGAAAAVGINRAVDVHLAQSKPQVECEPIFVALRTLPQGSPVTVWDVALRDWPKAMLPTTALRAKDEFEGQILRHPVREGQPLLSVQLVKAEPNHGQQSAPQVAESFVPPTPRGASSTQADSDLWTSGDADAGSTRSQPSEAAVETIGQTIGQTNGQPSSPSAGQTVAETSGGAAAPVAATAPPVATAAPEAVAAVPTTVASEPTLAEPPADALSATDAEPEPTSIVTKTAIETEPATQSPAPVVRYLVVPERIAMQADRSFVTAPGEQAPAPATDPAPAVTSPAAPAAAAAVGKQQRPQPDRGQASYAQASPTKRPAPQRQAKAVPRVEDTHTRTQPEPQPRPQPRFGSMFPNLRAGIDAVENELEAIRRDRAEPRDQQPTEGQPSAEAQQEPVQKAARWPWSTGRTPTPNKRSF